MGKNRVHPENPGWVCCCCGCLPVIGLAKAAVVAPPCAAFVTVANTAATVLYLPHLFLQATRVAYSTALLGPNLRVALLLLLTIAFPVLPLVVCASSFIITLLVVAGCMCVSVFDSSQPLFTGGVGTTVGNCWEFCGKYWTGCHTAPVGLAHRFAGIPEDWNGEYYEIRMVKILFTFLLAVSVGFPVGLVFAGGLFVLRVLVLELRLCHFALETFPLRAPWWWGFWLLLWSVAIFFAPVAGAVVVVAFGAYAAVAVGRAFAFSDSLVLGVAEGFCAAHMLDQFTFSLAYPKHADPLSRTSSTSGRVSVGSGAIAVGLVSWGFSWPCCGRARRASAIAYVEAGLHFAGGSRSQTEREREGEAGESSRNHRGGRGWGAANTSGAALDDMFEQFADEIASAGKLALGSGWLRQDDVETAGFAAVCGLPAVAVFRVLERSFAQLLLPADRDADVVTEKIVAAKTNKIVLHWCNKATSPPEDGENPKVVTCVADESIARKHVIAERLWPDVVRLWACMRNYYCATIKNGSSTRADCGRENEKSRLNSDDLHTALLVRLCVGAEPPENLTETARVILSSRQAESETITKRCAADAAAAEETLFKEISALVLLLSRLAPLKHRLGGALRRAVSDGTKSGGIVIASRTKQPTT